MVRWSSCPRGSSPIPVVVVVLLTPSTNTIIIVQMVSVLIVLAARQSPGKKADLLAGVFVILAE